ncbi:hypothetical protein DUI87_03236 [Hirundo rustica rustica]|uniref:ribonuclease H n=1 Tax=Hirundo rustica rustica TaxID=333673 RepID=A0A3M0L2Z2_HIRRU|nr:hypothetical protein DUI87_03236 [Hirundo rustica rustica]
MGIGNLLLVPEADYNLLGRDLIIEMGINIEVVNEEIKIKLCPLRVEDEEKINSEVWYTPDSVGRLNIPPFSVIIKDPETPIRVKQYPISPEGKNGLKPEIERLLSKGLLESCMSPFNTPILPIKKADGSYRLVHDLREINKRTVARFPVVANPYTLLSRLGPEKQYYSVIDLKDAFWACPLDEKSRDYFAFEWEDPVTHRRQQLRWTVLPQGFTESPNLFGQALEQILQKYQTGEGVTLIQYVDDLLIAGETEDKVRAESIRLLNFLSAKGLKVSKAKLQFVEEEVKYLGHYLRKGEKKIDPERVKGILSIPPPKSKKQIRQLLGLMGYCRQWIENYSTKVKFLYEKLSQGGLVKWDEKDDKHLKALQHDLVNAPVLSLPDLKRPFYLFVNTDSGTAYGVLTQEWAGKKKPVGYLSKLLDPVSRGWPTCLQALVACALLVEEANKITFNGELRVLSPHNIRGILQQKAEKWITDARLLKYEGILLDSPKLTLEVTALQNPAQFLYGRPSEDGLAHECLSTIEEQTKIRPDLDEEELEEGDRLFVDGSSRVINGKRVSGYAIVGGEGLAVIESGPLSGFWSAQACELYAVLRALQLLKDKSAEIVDCTCHTRLKGIRCDTPPVKYRNWDSYVKRQQSRPRGPPEEYPCCREDGTPRGSRQPSRRERQREYDLWEGLWKKALKTVLQEIQQTPDAQDSNDNDITHDHLCGEGDLSSVNEQIRLLSKSVLDKICNAAEKTFYQIPSPEIKTSYVNIKQFPSENFLQFLDCLRSQVERQVQDPVVQAEFIKEMAQRNGNETCRRIILSLPLDPSPSLTQMIEACTRRAELFSTSERNPGLTHPKPVAAAAPGARRQPMSSDQLQHIICHRCKRPGHFAKACPENQKN